MSDAAPFTPELLAQLAKVDIGLAAQQFLDGPLGKFLVHKAEVEVEDKVALLKEHDIVKDPKGAVKLQNEIWRAETFMYWIGDAIREGREITQELTERERQASVDTGGDATGS